MESSTSSEVAHAEGEAMDDASDAGEATNLSELIVDESFELGPDDAPPTDDDSDLASSHAPSEDGDDDDGGARQMIEVEPTIHEEPHEDMSAATLCAHAAAVYTVAVCDARPTHFATGGGDDRAYLWSTASLSAPLAALDGHSETVSSLAFSADGAYLATASLDGVVRVWDGETGAAVVVLEGPTQGINWLVWHARGTVLLAGSEDTTAWMWKVPEGSVMQIFSAHSASVSYGTFANGGRAIATASEDGTVRLWNPRSGTVEHTLYAGSPQEPCAVTCLCAHPAQAILLFGSEDGKVRLAQAESGKLLSSLAAHDASVETASFCDCLAYAATGGMDGKLCIWDLETSSLRQTCIHPGGVVEAAWRRGSPLLFTCSVSRELRLWDARSGDCLKTLTGHADAILCMALGYAPDGLFVVTGSDDSTARLWSIDV